MEYLLPYKIHLLWLFIQTLQELFRAVLIDLISFMKEAKFQQPKWLS